MPTFNLTIREHEEFGGNGIYFPSGRDYFQPTNGLGLAHDILEHPVTPHVNGYIDELMAEGAFLAGRVASGWFSKFGRRVVSEDIRQSIESLTANALMYDEELCPELCTSYIQDAELMAEIRSCVYTGLLQGVNEYEDAAHSIIPSHYKFDINSIVGWICKGHQLYRKRFGNNIYETSTYLFDKIASVSGRWLDQSEEGDKARLIVDFASFNVVLIPEEDY